MISGNCWFSHLRLSEAGSGCEEWARWSFLSFPFRVGNRRRKVTDCFLPFLRYCLFFVLRSAYYVTLITQAFLPVPSLSLFLWSSNISKLKYSTGEIVNNMKLFLWHNVGFNFGDYMWTHIRQRICLNAGGNFGGWMDFDVILHWSYLLWRNVG